MNVGQINISMMFHKIIQNSWQRSPSLQSRHPSVTLVQFLCKSSSWLRLQRQMAWLLHFIQFLKNPVVLSTFPRMITLTEMLVSSLKIVHIIQRQYFPDKLECLREGKQVSSNSKLATLDPILIDDVIQVGGRIGNASLTLDAIHPMILLNEHHVSALQQPDTWTCWL